LTTQIRLEKLAAAKYFHGFEHIEQITVAHHCTFGIVKAGCAFRRPNSLQLHTI
jgi:hypothetical protein